MRIVAFLTLLLTFQVVPAQTVVASLPHYPDWMYQNRLEELNKKTSINLDYNAQVQAFIDVYTVKRRDHLANIIGRSELYFPLFEEYLAKYDLPLELKYLAIVESALDPRAKSKSGAMGLWQFLFHASRMFDLKVETYIDERCDPVKSTDAACRYLQYLYHNLHDWQLALAAYNGGIGIVQKAIERSGGKTSFWELQPYLPAEVKSYVPAFIAVNYVMNNYSRHEIQPTPPLIAFNEVDTIFITKPLNFKQISTASGTDIEIIRWLNPSFTKDFVPANDEPVLFFLPIKNIVNFVKTEKNLESTNGPIVTIEPIGNTIGRKKMMHQVSKGEFFHKIAIEYHCRISDIMYWNQMKNRDLHLGQNLVIWKQVFNGQYFFVTDEIQVPEKLMWKESLLANEE